MGRFRESKSKDIPAISTASLPDIIFMLLFFFMISTSMKEVEYKVSVNAPSAKGLEALEKQNASFIYVGKPLDKSYGSEPRVQLDDAFADVSQIESYVLGEYEKKPEKGKYIVSLKIDKDCKMGIVTDIKQALRRARAYRISYSAIEPSENR